MANKKISELTTRTPSLSDLMLVGDPSSGYSFKCTVTALATIIETDIADGYVTLGTAQTISGAKTFSNNLTLTSVSNAGVDTDKFLVLSGSNVVNFRTGAEVLSDIGAQAALTNPITGTGTSGQVSYFNGTNSITSSPTFAFTPTSQLLVNNSVTASGAIARGINATPSLTAAANNDVLVGLDINPTFTNGAFTGVSNLGLRVNGNASVSLNQNAVAEIFLSNSTAGTSARSQLQVASNGDAVTFGKYSSTTTTYKIVNARDAHIYNLSFGDIAILNDNSSGGIKFAAGGSSTVQARIFSNGNVGINQNTDAGFRLDVNGTARVQGKLTVSTGGMDLTGTLQNFSGYQGYGQMQLFSGVAFQMFNTANNSKFSIQYINASGLSISTNSELLSGVLKGIELGARMNASANSQTLVALDIIPTFTVGAFTGVSQLALRTQTGDVVFGSTSGNVMIGTTTAGGRFTIQPTNNQVGMAISGSSLTGSNAQSLVSLSQTWNTTGNPTAIKLDVTNTASGANSYLLDLQVGGIPQFTVFKGGEIKTSSPAGGVAQTWKLGSVQAVTPTSPNRTIEVEVNGTTYYLHAKTTND
jgi:hypothetical protein